MGDYFDNVSGPRNFISPMPERFLNGNYIGGLGLGRAEQGWDGLGVLVRQGCVELD